MFVRVFGYIRVSAGSLWVHSGSFGSFAYTLPVVRFTHVHQGGRRAHSGSLDSFGYALGVIRMVGDRSVH